MRPGGDPARRAAGRGRPDAPSCGALRRSEVEVVLHRAGPGPDAAYPGSRGSRDLGGRDAAVRPGRPARRRCCGRWPPPTSTALGGAGAHARGDLPRLLRAGGGRGDRGSRRRRDHAAVGAGQPCTGWPHARSGAAPRSSLVGLRRHVGAGGRAVPDAPSRVRWTRPALQALAANPAIRTLFGATGRASTTPAGSPSGVPAPRSPSSSASGRCWSRPGSPAARRRPAAGTCCWPAGSACRCLCGRHLGVLLVATASAGRHRGRRRCCWPAPGPRRGAPRGARSLDGDGRRRAGVVAASCSPSGGRPPGPRSPSLLASRCCSAWSATGSPHWPGCSGSPRSACSAGRSPLSRADRWLPLLVLARRRRRCSPASRSALRRARRRQRAAARPRDPPGAPAGWRLPRPGWPCTAVRRAGC